MPLSSRVAMLAIVGLALGCSPCMAASNGPVASVFTAPVTRTDFTPVIVGFGQIEPNPASVQTVATAQAATVKNVYVRPGQTVDKGTPIATVVRAPSSEQSYLNAQTALKFAQSKVDRLQKLWASRLVTLTQLNQAKIALSNAKAALQALNRMGAQSKTETLRAPLSGVVTAVLVSEGDQVAQNAKIATMAPSNALAVMLGVDSKAEDQIHVGMPVKLTAAFDPSDHYKGTVSAVNRVVDPQTRLIDVLVKLEFSATDPPLIGSHVRGEIILPSRSTLSVPRSAVLYDKKGAYVFVVKDGRAKRVPVSAGLSNEDRISVTGALKAGMPVVVQGNYELRDGMKVNRIAHAVE